MLITISLVSFVLFFGVSISRSVIFYDLYSLNGTTGVLELRSDFNTAVQYRSMYHFFALSSYSSVSYLIFVVSIFGIAFINLKKIKKLGWFFMILVLVFLFSPFESYIIYRDIVVSQEIFFKGLNDINSSMLMDYMKLKSDSRISLLSGLSFLSQITVFILLVFKPLDEIEKQS